MMLKQLIRMISILTCSLFSTLACAYPMNYFNINSEARLLSYKAQNLNPQVIKLGLQAYLRARAEGLDQQQLLTIVDYSKPSWQRRLWVFDLKDNNILFQELVAHGKNSGRSIPTSFSDDPRSLKSSLGVYLTRGTYTGKHGYSLRLAGLERGYNDMAEAREIVVHAASYVSDSFARVHGRVGCSWGCFAVNPGVSTHLINTIKGGSLVFAYYPDRNWLSHSSFLS